MNSGSAAATIDGLKNHQETRVNRASTSQTGESQTMNLAASFLGRLEMRVTARYRVGDTPWGGRRVDFLKAGTFAGPRLEAQIVDGMDHMLRLADGTMVPDVKLVMRCADDALIYVTYRGYLHGDREQMDHAWRGEDADSSSFTVRTTVNFETGATQHAWLNHVIGVGFGERIAYPDGQRGIRFDIYGIL